MSVEVLERFVSGNRKKRPMSLTSSENPIITYD